MRKHEPVSINVENYLEKITGKGTPHGKTFVEVKNPSEKIPSELNQLMYGG